MPSPCEVGEGLNNSQVTGSSTIMLPRVTGGVTARTNSRSEGRLEGRRGQRLAPLRIAVGFAQEFDSNGPPLK
jgi:hypothetical protein